MSASNRVQQGKRKLDEAYQMTGVPFQDSIDDIREERLEPGSPAAVEVESGVYEPKVTLLLDPEFDYLDEHRQRISMEHEGFHAMRAKDDFDSFVNRTGDPEFQKAVGEIDSSGSMVLEEGLVQSLANAVDPYGHRGEVFRRQETEVVNDLFEDRDLDLDEIIDWTDSAVDELVDRYREVENVETVGSYRVEYGTFGGTGYVAVTDQNYSSEDLLAEYAVENYELPYGADEYEGEEKEDVWEPSFFAQDLEH